MSAQDLLQQLYKSFWDQKSVLTGAPTLSIDMSQVDSNTFNVEVAQKEMAALVSYMLGIEDVQKLDYKEALSLVEKHYSNQPQWQKLLLDYFAYNVEAEKEDIVNRQIQFMDEVLEDFDEEHPEAKEEE